MGIGSLAPRIGLVVQLWQLCQLWALAAWGGDGAAAPSQRLIQACDPGIVVADVERRELLLKLRISKAGRALTADFERQYGSLENLVIQWDSVSYSQVAAGRARSRVANSSVEEAPLGPGICVHLARKLPAIEHVADLAHELTHATRLGLKILKGEVDDVAEFVRARLTSRGGEADAFSVECEVKRELLGHWDAFCAPYAGPEGIDASRVIDDLYDGRLSASLTGETYPVMLSRQFGAITAVRRPAQDVNTRQARAGIRHSALVHTRRIQ